MIQGQKVIAFTPCGRKRYMDLLAGYVLRDIRRGLIDQWVLFDNPMVPTDRGYAQQLAAHFPWVKVVGVPRPDHMHHTIYQGYSLLTEADAIYVRLDDDLVYIHEDAISTLVKARIANPKPFLLYPVTIDNTRTSYQLQQHGKIPTDWGELTDVLCDPVSWTDDYFVAKLHQKALAAIENGTVVEEFRLPDAEALTANDGNISINCFAISGADMLACNVSPDEETYLSRTRPAELGRSNGRCGDAIFLHFAYGPQTEFMVKTGLLNDYVRLAPPLGFRTLLADPPRRLNFPGRDNTAPQPATRQFVRGGGVPNNHGLKA